MSSTLSSDRHSAAVRAVFKFDAPPAVRYRRDAEQIVISVGTAAVMVSPGIARALAHALSAGVDAAEGHWVPDETAAGADGAEDEPADG